MGFRDWLDHRTGYRKLFQVLLIEHIPGGAKWRYVWGSCLAFVFLVQLITGVLLMTAYSPGDSTAWSSVWFIQYRMDFGWLIRGLHHFGSQTMVVLLGLHMLQVVIAGAHLPPREVNWWLGLLLMAVVLALSLTGYLLPWDQKGYYATQVATNIAGSIPGIGSVLQKIIVGGPEYGNHTLTRFYALHVGILPPLMIVLVIAHLAVFRRHGVTTPPHAKGDGWFWPAQAFKDMVMSLIIFGVMLGMVVWGNQGNAIEPPAGAETGWYESLAHGGRDGRGANLDAPADPLTASYPARPEWYFLFLFQLLKYFPGDQEVIGTVLIPNGVGLLLFLLPLLGFGPMRKFGHVFGVLVVVGFLTCVSGLTYLALAADEVDPVKRWLLTKIGTVLVPAVGILLLVVLGLMGLLGQTALRKMVSLIGTMLIGAVVLTCGYLTYTIFTDLLPAQLTGLVQSKIEDKTRAQMTEQERRELDQVTKFHQARLQADEEALRAVALADQGIPENGARYLVRYDPLTKGRELFAQHCAVCHTHQDIPQSDKVKPTAADLTDWGSKEWLIGFLHDPNGPRFLGRVKDKEGTPVFSKMASWVKDQYKKAGRDGKTAELDKDLERIAEWLGSHPEGKNWEKSPLAEGYAAFQKLNCTSCHRYEPKKEKDFEAPDLTGYGSADWLRTMIMAPGNPRRYGDNNHMPAFRDLDGPAGNTAKLDYAAAIGKLQEMSAVKIVQLGDIERELIIRWLLKDYRVVFGGDPVSGPPRQK
jgi:ubiquinol-cytochrome c reductase cytochrome b subunit